MSPPATCVTGWTGSFSKDVSLHVTEQGTDAFNVAGRGEMHLSILIETMRREGYEFQVSTPRVLTKVIDGVRCEPVERMVADVPEASMGAVIEKIGQRKGDLVSMTPVGSRYRLEFLVPSRGLFGYRNEFLTDTRGEGIMSSVLDSYCPMKGEIARRWHDCHSLPAERQGIHGLVRQPDHLVDCRGIHRTRVVVIL